MAYCTQTDLETAVGGSATLVQLLDRDGDGTADSAVVTSVLDRATAEANSAIQVSVDLSTITSPYPDSLIFATANIGAYYSWLLGSSGQAVPDHIRALYDDALRWLDQVARRERTLGVVPRETTDQLVTQIDRSPAGSTTNTSATSRDDWGGMW